MTTAERFARPRFGRFMNSRRAPVTSGGRHRGGADMKLALIQALLVMGVFTLTLLPSEGKCSSESIAYRTPSLMAEAAPPSRTPCDDSLYVVLQKKSLDEMSEREYQYFVRKDTECDEQRRLSSDASTVIDTSEVAAAQLSTTSQHQNFQTGDSMMSHRAGTVLAILGTASMLVMMGTMAF